MNAATRLVVVIKWIGLVMGGIFYIYAFFIFKERGFFQTAIMMDYFFLVWFAPTWACSNLIFHNTQDMFHHSIETDIEGNIWAPSHLYPQSLSSEKVGRNIISDDGYYDDAIL